MVSLTLDLYKLERDIKTEIMLRLNNTDFTKNAIEGSRLLFALSAEQKEGNILYEQALNQLETWSISSEAGKITKDLAPLSTCFSFSFNESRKKEILNKIIKLIELSIKRFPEKFNVINDPEQKHTFAKINDAFDEKTIDQLRNYIRKNINGSIFRKCLFIRL